MALNILAEQQRPALSKPGLLRIESQEIPFQLVRNLRARRYVVRVRRDGTVRITIPRGGSIDFALDFARQCSAWIVRQLQKKRQAEALRSRAWTDGSEILFRGQPVVLRAKPDGGLLLVQFADHILTLPLETSDLRPSIENYLWSLAEKELIARTCQLAAQEQLTFQRVLVRNQRTRWGSCSPARTISLNWRLIQAPPAVRDYLIIHELMHLREMNHSARFWSWVAAACPEYDQAEAWLDAHNHLLH